MYNFGMPNQMQNQMMYNPFDTQRFSQNAMSLIRVTGIDGARAYQMNPNSTVALFDNNEDVMYIKTTDGAGFPTIRTFSFTEMTENVVANKNYVSREEMEEYVKQFISNQPKSNATGKQSTNSNDKSTMQ